MIVYGKDLTEEKMRSYWGKNVRVVCRSGRVYEGEAYFTSSADNEPDPATLSFGVVDIEATEIVTIEEL